MIWTVFEVIINFYQAALLIFFIRKRLTAKKGLHWWMSLGAAVMIGVGLTAYLFIDIPVTDSVLFIIPFIYAVLTSEEKWFYCFFWTVVLAMLFIGTSIVSSEMFISFLNIDWEGLMEQSTNRLIAIIGTNIALTIVISIAADIGNKQYVVSWKGVVGYLVVLLLEFIANEFIFVIQITYQDKQPMLLYASLCIFAIAILTIFLFEMMERSAYQQRQMELKLQTTQLIQTHQEEIRSIYTNMLAIQHDLRHRIAAAEQLLTTAPVESTATTELLKNSDVLLNRFITGNEMVDAILAAKTAIMADHDIRFEYVPYPLHHLPIQETDFCVLLSNLLDNAIEGVLRLPESAPSRTIKMVLTKSWSMFSINCENDANPETIHRRGDRFISSKKHAEIHGFGMQSMMTTVTAAGGWIDFGIRGRKFVVSIMLPMEEENV